MTNPVKYLLTAMLSIMLVITPVRVVLALSMSAGDPCASMAQADHGGETQHSAHQTSVNDDGSSDHSCCDDNDHNCSTDCNACTSLSCAITATSPVKTARRDLSNPAFITSTVPLRTPTPLLRPPATLHN